MCRHAHHSAVRAPPLPQRADGYLAGLNLRRTFTIPSSAPPPDSSGGGSSNTYQVVAIVVGTVGGCIVLLLVALAGVLYYRRRHGGVRRGAPGLGAETTLLVTDIENSTTLWENVEPEVMNKALEQHHGLIRALLVRHNAYESATEGDSFIIAFHTATDALAFAKVRRAAGPTCTLCARALRQLLCARVRLAPHGWPAARCCLVRRRSCKPG